MNINELVAARIKEIRTLQGKTCQALAEDLGITLSSYSALENGRVNITIERLYHLSQILETPIQNMLPETDFSCTFNVSSGKHAINATIYNNYQNKDMSDFMKNMVSMFHELAVKEKGDK